MREENKAEFILDLLLEYYNMTPEQLFKKTRSRGIVERRQLLFYLCRKYTALSFSKIGKMGLRYGYKYDHATVLYACNTINDLKIVDKNISNDETFLSDWVSKKLVSPLSREALSFKMKVTRILRSAKTKDIMVNEILNII